MDLSLSLSRSVGTRFAMRLTLALILTLASPRLGAAEPAAVPSAPDLPSVRVESAQEHDACMRWWREARFGMFVHWNLSSVLAGRYHGQPAKFSLAEWIMHSERIPMREYQAFGRQSGPANHRRHRSVSKASLPPAVRWWAAHGSRLLLAAGEDFCSGSRVSIEQPDGLRRHRHLDGELRRL